MSESRRADLILVLLGIVGLVAIWALYETAFPVTLVDLEVTREEAIENATAFLTEQGADLEGYRRAALFSGDTEALVFLQRTQGLEAAGEWARQRVPIWSWNIRWFRPEETEEWLAFVGVDGEIVGFRHVIEEAAEGADLEEGAARAVALEFLRARGRDPDDLEEVQASAERKDNRTDHLFTWQIADTEIEWQPDDPGAGTGSARVRVRVLGDRVGGYGTFLDVPEAFSREFQGTLSTGQFLAIGSIALSVILAVVAMVMAIVRTRSGQVRWRAGIVCGAVVGVLIVVYTLTAWPQAMFQYQTQVPWTVFLGIMAVGLVLAAIFYVVFVLFPTVTGEALAREYYPDTLHGFLDVVRGRVLTPEMAAASLRGYALAAALLGYLTLFYWLAQRYLGAWLPAEGPYSDIFNNALPFLAPLTVGLVAAVSEEVIYRLFGITLFRKLTGSTAVALVIPAAIWAFGHSNYPVFPVYVRGIELTIGGVLFGLAFLRFGLLTVIVAHYVIDAVVLGLPLVTSGSGTYVVFGALAMGLALVPAVLGWFGRGRVAAATGGDGPPPAT